MKRRMYDIFLYAVLIMSLCSCGGNKQDPKDSKDKIMLTAEDEMFDGTANVTKEGVVFDTASRTPELTIANGLSINISEKKILAFEIKNTSDITDLKISFITEGDPEWTDFKSAQMTVEKSDDFTTAKLDLSGAYGWLGTLTGLKIRAEGISSGEIVMKSVSFLDGGESGIKNIEIGAPEVAYTVQDKMKLGITMAPDGILGTWYDSEGKLRSIGSAFGKPFITAGTPDAPFGELIAKNIYPENYNAKEFQYYSIAQVIRDPNSDLLVGITHLERHRDMPGVSDGYIATLGLSISYNDGLDWKFLGEMLCHNLPVTDLTVSREIGNGTIYVDDEYLYIFAVDMHAGTKQSGMSVTRIRLNELFEKCGQEQLPEAYKYKDGKWEEPAWEGDFDDILPEDVAPNFCYIMYNTILDKYFMAICHAPYYAVNDGDILLLASDNLTDWSKAERQYIACAKLGEQYPTLISMEQDPQTTSGDKFYLYYCRWNAYDENGNFDWQHLWGTAEYIRQNVTIKK